MGTAAGSVDLELPRLVWGIESEVALIGSLCGRIDQHVRALNLARAEAARRLEALDALVAAAEDPQLQAWLERVTQTALPQLTETFPDRLYAD